MFVFSGQSGARITNDLFQFDFAGKWYSSAVSCLAQLNSFTFILLAVISISQLTVESLKCIQNTSFIWMKSRFSRSVKKQSGHSACLKVCSRATDPIPDTRPLLWITFKHDEHRGDSLGYHHTAVVSRLLCTYNGWAQGGVFTDSQYPSL